MFMNFDLPIYGQTTLQDPTTDIAIDMSRLNTTIMFYLIIILSFVIWTTSVNFYLSAVSLEQAEGPIVRVWKENFLRFLRVKEQTILELVWTIAPAIILVLLAIPSFTLLYQAEEKAMRYFAVSVIGHQWYWEYGYPFNSKKANNIPWYELIATKQPEYLHILSMISEGNAPRLVGANTKFIVPSFSPVKFFVTSEDVIHSFAIPVAGLKIDAVPGRLNAVTTIIERESVFHGACSELCGVNHGFMPIVGVTVNPLNYKWMLNINRV
jgi:cytochrome c oxidase subunit 2